MEVLLRPLNAPGGQRGLAALLVDDDVGLDLVLLLLGVHLLDPQVLQAPGELIGQLVHLGGLLPWPEMIRGVRASSIRIESTSSTMAK